MLASSSARRVVRLLVGALALLSFVEMCAAEAGSAGGDGREHIAVEKMRVSELRSLLTRRGVDCQVGYVCVRGACGRVYMRVILLSFVYLSGILSFTIISFGILQWVML